MASPLTIPGDQLGWFTHGTIPGVSVLSFNGSTSLYGFDIQNAGTILQTILFPRLVNIDHNNATGGTAVMSINGNAALNFVFLPWLETSFAPLVITNNGSLTNVDIRTWEPINGQDVHFNGNALTEESVDNVLARCFANGSYQAGTIYLDGGTNSPPSAAGVVVEGSLVARGAYVFTN